MTTVRRDTRYVRRRDYTDVFVLLGLTMREVEQDYTELARRVPERFLGFRVVLATPDARLRGMRITDYMVLPRAGMHPKFDQALQCLEIAMIESVRRN